jgi:putative ABC transport system substrate-binding protein
MIFRTKSVIAIVAITLFVSSFVFMRYAKKQNSHAKFTIGILQTASHPALDAVREGFIEQAQKGIDKNIAFVVKNAQGSVPAAQAIAHQFHGDKSINAILAIATPAAQAINSVEKEKPIIIAAVTDPSSLGLGNNVTGVKDMIDVKAAIDMLQQLVPQAQTIGLLYTNAEANSVALVKLLRAELESRGLETMDFAVTSEAEMPAAAERAFAKTDVILSPTDNSVASSIALISSIAHKYKKPFIASDNLLVRHGALAARGIDYRENGKQAAQLAKRILIDGKSPAQLPIEQQKNDTIYINKNELNALGLRVPQALENTVTLVE